MNSQAQLKDYEKVINFYIRMYKDRGVSEEKLREVCYKKTEELFEQYKNKPNFNIIKDIKYDWFIKNEITRTIIENTSNIKTNKEQIDRINNYFRTVRKLKSENREINSKVLASEMNYSEDDIIQIEKLLKELDEN